MNEIIDPVKIQDSFSKLLPRGWDIFQLGMLISYIKSGLSRAITSEDIGIPVITSTNLVNEYLDNTDLKYWYERDPQGARTSDYILDDGDILLNFINSTAQIGKVCIFRDFGRPAIYTTNIFRIKPNDKVTTKFLWRFLSSTQVQSWIQLITKPAINQASFTQGDFCSIPVCIPVRKEEQEAITKALDTIDEAIALTDAHIAKLKKAKAGLLHDLLTRGIDEHGELRDPIQYPEQFRDSPLGKVPKDWEVITLGEVVGRSGGFIQTGPFGSQLHAYEYVNSGVPVIMPQDILNGRISTEQIGYITSDKAQSLKRHIVQLNDVVFARRGDLNRCAAIGRREENWFCGTGSMLARMSKHEIDGFWLAAIYQHYISQRQILARAVGSTMVNLNSTLLNSLIIAKPDIAEQNAIMERAAIQDTRLQAKESLREKLKLLKKGLMSDLLTGRVRVKVDL